MNRIKVAPLETRRKNKWLTFQLGNDESNISHWCSNPRQLSLENLLKKAIALKIDIRELLNTMKD